MYLLEIFMPKPPKETFSFQKLNNITPEAINEILTCLDWSDFTTTNINLDNRYLQP